MFRKSIRVKDIIELYKESYDTIWSVSIDEIVYDVDEIPRNVLHRKVDKTINHELTFDITCIDIYTKNRNKNMAFNE